MLSKTRTEILTSEIRVRRPWGYRRSFPVSIFQRLLPYHAIQSIASLSTASPRYTWNLRLLNATLTTRSRNRMPKYVGCCPRARRGTGYRHCWSRPVLTWSSGSQDPSVPVASPHHASLRYPTRSRRDACCEMKSRHDMAGFAKGMATTSGWPLVRCDCRTLIQQDRALMDRSRAMKMAAAAGNGDEQVRIEGSTAHDPADGNDSFSFRVTNFSSPFCACS